jgi:hypothetical protein
MGKSMKRRYGVFLGSIFLMVIQAFAAVQDQVQGSFGSWIDLRPGGAKVEFGQTFQPGIAGRLESIEHSGLSPGSVAEYPTMFDIVDVVGEQPGTNLLGRTVITNISAQTRVYFTNQSIYLEANTAYAIVASTEAPLTGSREYYFRASFGDEYLPGRLWARAPGGAWAPGDMWGTPRDLVFATYMEPGIPPVRITKPAAGAQVSAGSTVEVAAAISSQVTNVSAVEFLANGVLLGGVSNEPFKLNWTPSLPGAVDLLAILQTTAGVSMTSSVCSVTVSLVRPDNDDFADRTHVTGEVVVGSINQTNASVEAGEPQPFPTSAGRTLWWEWTAPRKAWATIGVTPAFDTNALIGVYSGSQVEALYQAAVSTGAVVCLVDPATPSQILVDARAGVLSANSLALVLNDIEITSPAANAVFHAPAIFNLVSHRTALVRSLTTIEVSANGAPLGQMTLGSNQLPCSLSMPGYYDLRLMASDTEGIATYSQKVPIIVRPANDAYLAATPVSGREVVLHDSNLAATKQTQDPQWAQNQGGHSIWYKWTAPADGMCLIDGRGTNFALLINVCLGTTFVVTNGATNISSFSVVAANALAPTYGRVQFDAVAGKTYLISVDGFFGEEGELDWSLHLGPYNDNFNARLVLSGISSGFIDSNSGATVEPAEGSIAPPGAGTSVWYSWQAPLPGTVDLRVNATNPLALAVFTGTSLSNLVLVAQSPGGWTNSPRLTFESQAGEIYQIAVFGSGGLVGSYDFELSWQGLRLVSPLPNSVWSDPTVLTLEARLEVAGKIPKEMLFRVNGDVIGTVTNAPFALTWPAPQAGTYTLTAHAVATDDSEYESVPITCLVYADANMPRPKVYAGVQSDTSYVLNAVGALYLFGAYAPQFGRATSNVLSTPFLAKWPSGVTGWKEISGSWAIGDDGNLYQNGRTLIPFPAGVTGWKHVSRGFNGVVTISDDGELYSGGTSHIDVPRPSGGWKDAHASLAGVNRVVLALGENQEAYAVSSGVYGDWSSSLLSRPSGVSGWKAIANAGLFGVLLTDDDELWIYGFYGGVTGTSGQYGFSHVQRPPGVNRWVDFAAGGFHVLAIGDDAQLYAWGRNWEHQLGIAEDQNPRGTPVKVELPPGVTGWSAVAGGQFHSLAIGQDCGVYAWGENGSGQLGQAASVPRARPVRVGAIEALCGTPVLFADSETSHLPDGSFRIEFNTDLNRAYLIQYSDAGEVWKTANSSVIGNGGVVEWIDDGPPKTDAHPSTATSRMYRVIYAP